MTRTNIHTDREKTIAASKFINENRKTALISWTATTNFYMIDGIKWAWWHEGTGTFPEIA